MALAAGGLPAELVRPTDGDQNRFLALDDRHTAETLARHHHGAGDERQPRLSR